jgi:hypothetical protein
LPDGLVFEVSEEEELVFQNRAAEIAAKAVVIKPRHGRKSATLLQSVERVVISVLVILVRQPMKFIRAALHDGVELAAGRMAEFRRKLILQDGKFGNGVIRHFDQWPSDRGVVVVHTFDGEIVIPRTLAAHGRSRSHSHAAA